MKSQLHISEVDEKTKRVKSLVRVFAPGYGAPETRIIGSFPSKSIKVISKPSKKRSSVKNVERAYRARPHRAWADRAAEVSMHPSWDDGLAVQQTAVPCVTDYVGSWALTNICPQKPSRPSTSASPVHLPASLPKTGRR